MIEKRELVLQVRGNNYSIKFPNVGQLVDIETRKQQYSAGMYSSMVNNYTNTSLYALDVIDAQACFGVLAPDLLKDLKVKTLSQLDPVDFEDIRLAYRDQFLPWFKQWESVLKDTNVTV